MLDQNRIMSDLHVNFSGTARRRQSRLRHLPSYSTSSSSPKTSLHVRTSTMERSRTRRRLVLPILALFLILQFQFSIVENTVDGFLNGITRILLEAQLTPALALWRGSTMQINGTQTMTSSLIKVDLVISHCDTALNWIFDDFAPNDYQFANIIVFSKCNKQVQGVPSDAKIVRLPNVGRCDHTYAHYLAKYYMKQPDQTSSSSYVMFLKDNSNKHRLVYSRHRQLSELIQIASTRGFACHEERLWNIGTLFHPICQISAFHSWPKLRQKDMNSYVRVSRDREQLSHFSSQHGSSLGEYADYLGISTNQSVVPVCYGGNFLASTEQFQRHASIWPKMETTLSRASNVAEGHFVERIWALLLSKPLNDVETNIILDQAQQLDCVKKNFIGSFSK